MKTNRDLYECTAGLLREKQEQTVPLLETYLSSLISRAVPFADRNVISLDDFFGILRDAFDGDGGGDMEADGATPEFREWKALVWRQIVDLQAMARNGQLQEKYRYFGITAPSGGRWYNFDPCTYIECGIAGAFGGWEEGDDTGRIHVPGPVACIGADGKVTACDPKELHASPAEVAGITWQMFSDFVWCGQIYE